MRKLNIGLLLILSAMFLYVRCSDDEKAAYELTLGSPEGTGSEDGSTQQVEFILNQAASEDVAIEFEVKGTASLNGDYKLTSSSPLTLKAGEQSVMLEFELIDDKVIEQEDKTIIFRTGDIAGITLPDTQQNPEYTFTITDNDEVPDNSLQVDLTWTLGEGEDIDEVDLDLFLAKDVVVENDYISDFTLVEDALSANETGFESINISTELGDDEYYVVVYYNLGNSSVDYTIGYAYVDIGDEVQEAEGTFNSDEEGYSVFYGPITKSGTSFGKTGRPRLYKVYMR